jgi:putative DNA methylase
MTGGNCTPYGLTSWGQLFTDRQIVALTTFSDLVREARERVILDIHTANLDSADDNKSLRDGGAGASAYADAIAVYLGLAISRWTDLFCALSTWNTANQNIKNLFSRQAIPMAWDYAESNPFGSGASFISTVTSIFKLFVSFPVVPAGTALQLNACSQAHSGDRIVSTDPPYYDNIGYADLSDFFYVWLRRSLQPVFPDLFATLAVPKADELVATAYRHGGKDKAEAFFLDGMTRAMRQLAGQTHPAFPVTIYYAFKQSESGHEDGTSSTGWETFLEALFGVGFAISGTWPVRTERTVALKKDVNALASSIVLVCRQRPDNAPTATRRDFLSALKAELPVALKYLQRSNIAPVDLAQAAIGPGMAVYTRFAKVLDAEGRPLTVRNALVLINQTLDEVLAEQEGDFDADSRWALAWFEQFCFASAEYGLAETLSKAKNTSVAGLVEAGVLASKAGKVRLLKPEELPEDWDPTTDDRLTVWEMVHHLIRVLEAGGESAAAVLAAKMDSKTEVVRELAYRLYTLCERKKRAPEALAYNALVQSLPEITRLAREGGKPVKGQTTMFEEK